MHQFTKPVTDRHVIMVTSDDPLRTLWVGLNLCSKPIVREFVEQPRSHSLDWRKGIRIDQSSDREYANRHHQEGDERVIRVSGE